MPSHRASFIAFLVALGSPLWSSSTPKAVRGVIDLRSFDLNRTIVGLKGEWRFRWRELYVSKPAQGGDEQGIYTLVPKAWNDIAGSGFGATGHGFGTYSLKILLREDAGPLAIRMDEQGTAVRVYANGKEVGSAGTVSTGKHAAVPDTRPLTLILTDKASVLNLDL